MGCDPALKPNWGVYSASPPEFNTAVLMGVPPSKNMTVPAGGGTLGQLVEQVAAEAGRGSASRISGVVPYWNEAPEPIVELEVPLNTLSCTALLSGVTVTCTGVDVLTPLVPSPPYWVHTL